MQQREPTHPQLFHHKPRFSQPNSSAAMRTIDIAFSTSTSSTQPKRRTTEGSSVQAWTHLNCREGCLLENGSCILDVGLGPHAAEGARDSRRRQRELQGQVLKRDLRRIALKNTALCLQSLEEDALEQRLHGAHRCLVPQLPMRGPLAPPIARRHAGQRQRVERPVRDDAEAEPRAQHTVALRGLGHSATAAKHGAGLDGVERQLRDAKAVAALLPSSSCCSRGDVH
mmetsp:Transcript_43159/g.136136  ORF Transcript_43159/g.136136 Transcript_43159/m.136136 type:complete len:227 (-) Transcript_43159:833-1513(-)